MISRPSSRSLAPQSRAGPGQQGIVRLTVSATRFAGHDGLIRHDVAGRAARKQAHVDPAFWGRLFLLPALARLARQGVQGQQRFGGPLKGVASGLGRKPGMRRAARKARVGWLAESPTAR